MKKARSKKGHRCLCDVVFCEISQLILAVLLFMAPIGLIALCGFIMELFPNFF